jgi:MFS transporter, ACS family, D-galactonate transporter
MSTQKPTNVRWFVFFALLILCAINYFDRAVISICMPLIQKDLNFSPEMTGLILSSFFWGYCLMQIPVGWISDRFSPGKLIVSSGIGWGILQIMTGFVSTAPALMIIRTLLGISESPIYPTGAKLQSVWLPATERGRGAALFDSGAAFGIALGGPIVALMLGLLGGWRGALIGAGVITIVFVILCYRIMQHGPETNPNLNQAERDYIKNTLAAEYEESQKLRLEAGKTTVDMSDYLRHTSFWGLMIGFFSFDSFWFGLMTWGPLYLAQTQGLQISGIGWALFCIYGIGVIGEFLGGSIADQWRRRGGDSNTVIHTIMIVSSIFIAGFMFLLSTATNVYYAIALLTGAMFFNRALGCMYWGLPSSISQRKHVGTVAGAMNFLGNLGGVLTPILVGLIVGATGNYFWALMMFVVFGLGSGVFPLLINVNKKIGA